MSNEVEITLRKVEIQLISRGDILLRAKISIWPQIVDLRRVRSIVVLRDPFVDAMIGQQLGSVNGILDYVVRQFAQTLAARVAVSEHVEYL